MQPSFTRRRLTVPPIVFYMAATWCGSGLAACTRQAQTKPVEYPKRSSLQPPACEPADASLGYVQLATTLRASPLDAVEEIDLSLDENGVVHKVGVESDDEKTLPKSVIELGKQQFPGYEVSGYEVEHYRQHGKVYEVELKKGDEECELAVLENGRRLYHECEAKPADLPPAVTAALQQRFPKAEIEEVERHVTADNHDQWRVEAKLGEAIHYLSFQTDGALLRHQRKFEGTVYLDQPLQ